MKNKLIALLLAAASILALAGCAPEKAAEAAVPAGVAVQVKTVERRDVAAEERVSGAVSGENETSVYVAANAKCLSVNFEAGDIVREGDVICTLDLASTRSSYNAAKISYDSAVSSYNQQKELFDKQLSMLNSQIGQYESAMALREESISLNERTLELREKNLADTKSLFAIGAASQAEVDAAQLELDGAKMQLDSARVELDGMKTELDGLRLQVLSTTAQRDSTLSQLRAGMESYRSNLEQLEQVMGDVDGDGNVVAPVGGRLVSLNAAEGNFISAGYPVAVICDAELMKVTVYVSEALVPKLHPGDAARVSIASAGVSFDGSIRTVDQTVNPQTRLYSVVIGVPSDVSGLISGMFADVTFFTQTSPDTVAIPSEAILTINGEQYVYVVEDGAAKRAVITTGLNGDGVTEVYSGLSAGQQLVVVGQQYLSDGDAVRVVGG
ncbi:MAG: efflux RND transporter periplasmic adaptor subunit [Oscillospiraceae bacterium]|nr:efflux RND transporter periplasmic adaptor subunit [Oscillospiraceae bacterium]